MSSVFARVLQRAFGAVLVGSCALFTQCRANEVLDDHPWPCTAEAPDCGDFDGKPMKCWEGFCMPSCDFEHPPIAGGGQECLFGDVLVRTCDPTPDENLDAECGPGFHCYRTDLIFPVGICVPFPVCSDSSECRDDKHNVCASNAISKLADDASGVKANRFTCIAEGCARNPAICAEDEACLAPYYQLGANALPDICVPRCDGARKCLPNYTCARSDWAPGGDLICMPGLPGVRCEHQQDCAFGFCLPTAAGFSVCSISCKNDEGCKSLNSDPTYYRCVEGKGGTNVCATLSPFQGVRCNDDSECPSDAPRCTPYSPYLPADKSECRPTCDDDSHCPPRAGLAQVCLEADHTCYPGSFSLPCKDDSECLTPYTCNAVEREERDFLKAEKICTIACTDTGDCQLDPADPKRLDHANLGYCDGSFCRLGFLAGELCQKDEECRTRKCSRGVCL